MIDPAASTSSTPWSLDGLGAVLAYCGLKARVDAAAPRGGFKDLAFQGHAFEGQLLGVDAGGDVAPDAVHVRGADLIAVYRERPDRPYAVEVYWSVSNRPAGEVILDATVSIQTRQWEAYPSVTVASQAPGAEGAAFGDTIRVLRPEGFEWSFVEVVPAEDFVSDVPRIAAATSWRFGPQFMERGVIRRLRVRGGFVDRRGDAATAQRLLAELQTEAPPLTA